MATDNEYMLRAKLTPSVRLYDSKVESPKVTVGIPTFRRPDKLAIAVESVLNQEGYDNYEVMVVDNDPVRGCDTEIMMAKYAHDPHFTYYKNSANIGMEGNWNKLYLLAKGEYVVMLHDDDRLYPDFLRRLFVDYIDYVEQYDIIFPNYCKGDRLRRDYDGYIGSMRWDINDLIVYNLIGAPLGMTMQRGLPELLGGFSGEFYPSSDEEFYVRAMSRGYTCFSVFDRPFAFYNETANASSDVRNFLSFYTKQGPKIFETYRSHFNPVLRFLKGKAGCSFDRFKLEHHSVETKMAHDPAVKGAIATMKAAETPASRLALKAFLNVAKIAMGISRRHRRKVGRNH